MHFFLFSPIFSLTVSSATHQLALLYQTTAMWIQPTGSFHAQGGITHSQESTISPLPHACARRRPWLTCVVVIDHPSQLECQFYSLRLPTTDGCGIINGIQTCDLWMNWVNTNILEFNTVRFTRTKLRLNSAKLVSELLALNIPVVLPMMFGSALFLAKLDNSKNQINCKCETWSFGVLFCSLTILLIQSPSVVILSQNINFE